MDLRHLEVLAAICEAGSFSAAADLLHTVQSNVSDQIRQLERELGVPVLVRGRRGASPTEFGRLVLGRARRIRGEIEALHADLSMTQGLRAGHASLGIVGTASRWLVPALVADLRERAPGVGLRVNEGATERLLSEVIRGEVAMAVLTEPAPGSRLLVEHLLDEEYVGLVPPGTPLEDDLQSFQAFVNLPLILPPVGNPVRDQLEAVAAAHGLKLAVPVEVEGIRLIADLVAAGQGASILPSTAVPHGFPASRRFALIGMPKRRLALVTSPERHLSLAELAVREAVLRLAASQQRRARRARRTAPLPRPGEAETPLPT